MSERFDLYSQTAHSASAQVISGYSTSFGLATKLLPQPIRRMIRDVYALVRVADEIVDGSAAEAGLSPEGCSSALDALEAETLTGMATGFSTNVVVHSYAQTARRTGIEDPLVAAFFSSMRRDLDPVIALSESEYRRYVYGSAEVVGLMCLRAFTYDEEIPAVMSDQLERGARRLGAAFQKINFLRDLADDSERLGRTYIPGTGPEEFDDQRKTQILDEIDGDLRVAHAAIPLLPPGPRRATAAAAALFGELNQRLRSTSVAELQRTRVSVPAPKKLKVISGAVVRRRGRSPWLR